MFIYYQDTNRQREIRDNVVHISFVKPVSDAGLPEARAEVIDLGYYRARKMMRDIEAEYLRQYPYFF